MECCKPDSFDELYGEFGPRIYRFCHRLCGNHPDAEDLCQDVLVLVFQNLEQHRGHHSIWPWLYRITLHRWQRLQSRARAVVVSLDESPSPPTSNPMPAELERLLLENALAALPEPLRQAFILVKAEGLKYREAAEVLGIPQGTVQSRVHDASVQLRALLAEEQLERGRAETRPMIAR